MRDLGRHVYGLAAVALGLIGLCWGDFASVWQPLPADFAARTQLAYAAALLLLVSGVAIQWRRTAKAASLLLAALYLVFVLGWARRVIAAPQTFGTWLGVAEQSALVLGGIVSFASLDETTGAARIARVGRIVFGICLVAFGVAHLIYVRETAAMVPNWLPPNPKFWAVATGGAHLAAGLALLSGIAALPAARLATVMFVGFGLLVWLPRLVAQPAMHMVWSGNGVNLALVGALWVVADAIRKFASSR
jgi:uncharacterized membrane protein YphA (DoxX/SURF4 family)